MASKPQTWAALIRRALDYGFELQILPHTEKLPPRIGATHRQHRGLEMESTTCFEDLPASPQEEDLLEAGAKALRRLYKDRA